MVCLTAPRGRALAQQLPAAKVQAIRSLSMTASEIAEVLCLVRILEKTKTFSRN